jgi:urease accessory protein
MSRSVLHLVSGVAAGALLPGFAYAHVVTGDAGGFLHGLMHPALGLDHVCAMVAVGLWAAQMGGRAVWAMPLTFVGVMALGGALGMAGGALPFAEQGIVLSVLTLGVLVAAAVRLPLAVSGALVGLFALCHGHAHGMEMPGAASAAGFLLTTAALHLTGVLFGLGVQRAARQRLVPVAGAGIALCGMYLAVA